MHAPCAVGYSTWVVTARAGATLVAKITTAREKVKIVKGNVLLFILLFTSFL
jgi:hypothetical protein